MGSVFSCRKSKASSYSKGRNTRPTILSRIKDSHSEVYYHTRYDDLAATAMSSNDQYIVFCKKGFAANPVWAEEPGTIVLMGEKGEEVLEIERLSPTSGTRFDPIDICWAKELNLFFIVPKSGNHLLALKIETPTSSTTIPILDAPPTPTAKSAPANATVMTVETIADKGSVMHIDEVIPDDAPATTEVERISKESVTVNESTSAPTEVEDHGTSRIEGLTFLRDLGQRSELSMEEKQQLLTAHLRENKPHRRWTPFQGADMLPAEKSPFPNLSESIHAGITDSTPKIASTTMGHQTASAQPKFTLTQWGTPTFSAAVSSISHHFSVLAVAYQGQGALIEVYQWAVPKGDITAATPSQIYVQKIDSFEPPRSCRKNEYIKQIRHSRDGTRLGMILTDADPTTSEPSFSRSRFELRRWIAFLSKRNMDRLQTVELGVVYPPWLQPVSNMEFLISLFGEDDRKEVYLLDYRGRIADRMPLECDYDERGIRTAFINKDKCFVTKVGQNLRFYYSE